MREAYPDGDLAVLAGDCNLEIPHYLQTLTVDWRRYVFWCGSGGGVLLSRASLAPELLKPR